MTTRQDELSEFLKSRRARLAPADVGLAAARNGRRVTGLRREELAMLAGVSPDYYARLEQGRAANVSDQVLDAVAAALRLDDLERRHLTALVKPARERVCHRTRCVCGPSCARWSMRWTRHPQSCTVLGSRYSCINRAAAALIDDFDAMPEAERNMVRWMFLDPKARLDLSGLAGDRRAAGGDPAGGGWTRYGRCAPCRARHRTVGSFRRSSPAAWADRNLFQHTHGPKRFHHEAIGTITRQLRDAALCLPIPGFR